MTIKPVKFTVGKPLKVEGHQIKAGVYVGQMLAEIANSPDGTRRSVYFLHAVLPATSENGVGERIDVDVSDLVAAGRITVS